MEFFFGNSNEGYAHCNQDIARCPFLKNIHEPTNLSFSTSITTPMPARNGKGPIFEDGPNFDTAFKLFHGQNGVVPLSEKSFTHDEKCIAEQVPAQFNPLAAKAATISLSSFGPGGPFGFDAFSKKWKKDKKQSNSSKKDSSSSKPKGGKPEHEAMGNEWLQNGNCPIAKSYQAVSKVLPLVAKTIQLPAGMKYKCPQVIIAARSALAKTAFAKNLRPQPLSSKVLVIGVLGMAANIPLGVWREHTEKFSVSWFAAVHAAVPFIAMLRKSVLMPKSAMALTIAASILGQVIGSRAERYRLKAIGLRRMEFDDDMPCEVPAASSPRTTRNGRCAENNEWKSNALQVTVASPSTTAALY